jgi:hypothetical protein
VKFPGLLDHVPCASALVGHVVSPDPEPRLHGYEVRGDLAKNVSFLDLGWLALTGQLPTDAERAAVGRALAWLSPMHVGEGPAHAAVLTRVAGAPDAVLPGVVGVALGQHTAAEISTANQLFAWLEGREEAPAAWVVHEPNAADLAAHDDLVRASIDWFDVPLPARPVLTRVAGAYALFHRLGIVDPVRLHALSAWARLPVLLAEAACTRPGSIASYPTRLPDYEYVEDR